MPELLPNLTEQNRFLIRLEILKTAYELKFSDNDLLAVLVEMTSEIIANRHQEVDDCVRLVDSMASVMRDAVRRYPKLRKRENNGRFLRFEYCSDERG